MEKIKRFETSLFWVLIVLAPLSLANALSVVPRAKLSRELRFRALAAVNVANFTLQKILTVMLAALGLGRSASWCPCRLPARFVAAFLWWWVRPPWALRPQLRRWRYLVSDSTRLLGGRFRAGAA